MKLIIIHYHLRPGGIRRVLELATPSIVRESAGRITSVIVATGEAPDARWREAFLRALRPTPVDFFVAPAFGYASEQTRRPPAVIRQQVQEGLDRLFAPNTTEGLLVWAHNLGLARNPALTRELARACTERGIPLVAHHHDWWFDNRWQRWQEIRRAGFKTLDAAARMVFDSRDIHHVAINHADADVLKKHFHRRATWLPNPVVREPLPSAAKIRAARDWLQARLKTGRAPVWILPCRLLRRKNIAEALLLKNWLRPEAWLVTTGGVSSDGERNYFEKLNAAAHAHHWRLRLGVLAGDEARKPVVAELLAASEAVLLTSIQEGFGLPYLEAAAAGRPLIARHLPNVAPDLASFGFRFPQSYDEILIHPSLFDWATEQQRQQRMFANWEKQIAPPCRKWVKLPVVLAADGKPQPVPFSRLTLTAQLEVLQQPAAFSWRLCAPLNPFLTVWQRRAQAGRLQVTRWPRQADHWLGGTVYAKKFERLLKVTPAKAFSSKSAFAAQTEFLRVKLSPEYLYPLLWNHES